MKNEHIIIDDLDVQYAEQGNGSVVLLLHGWGTSLTSFNELIPAWGDRDKRFIALNLPGFGGSELPPTAWGVSEYSSFVKSFLTKLGINQPEVIIGHSLGGRIAIKSISSGNLKPKYLVLIASAGTSKRRSARSTFFMIIAKVGKLLTSIPPLSIFRSRLKKRLYAATGSSDYLNAGLMKDTFLKIVRENLTEDARRINVPTLLVWGKNDTVTPLTEAYTLRDVIKGSRLDVIPQAGHFVHQVKSKEVAESIASFTNL